MNIEQRKFLSQYLRTQLEINEKEIAELEAPVDPYAELKAAHAAGKRIAMKLKDTTDDCWFFEKRPVWTNRWDYKIIEDDETDTLVIHLQKLNKRASVKFTKCALTGKITAEVVA